jgi:hypothetical protein
MLDLAVQINAELVLESEELRLVSLVALQLQRMVLRLAAFEFAHAYSRCNSEITSWR